MFQSLLVICRYVFTVTVQLCRLRDNIDVRAPSVNARLLNQQMFVSETMASAYTLD